MVLGWLFAGEEVLSCVRRFHFPRFTSLVGDGLVGAGCFVCCYGFVWFGVGLLFGFSCHRLLPLHTTDMKLRWS